jgi:iodotyrosine deiodinase
VRIVVVFEQLWGEREDGARRKHYCVRESVGIACGIFIAALHTMGLATLTHTPSQMLQGSPASRSKTS